MVLKFAIDRLLQKRGSLVFIVENGQKLCVFFEIRTFESEKR